MFSPQSSDVWRIRRCVLAGEGKSLEVGLEISKVQTRPSVYLSFSLTHIPATVVRHLIPLKAIQIGIICQLYIKFTEHYQRFF